MLPNTELSGGFAYEVAVSDPVSDVKLAVTKSVTSYTSMWIRVRFGEHRVMITRSRHTAIVALASAVLTLIVNLNAQNTVPGPKQGLAGIWGTEQCLGPLVRGILIIDGRYQQWHASIAGFDVLVDHGKGRIAFALPYSLGEFRGRLETSSNAIIGEWIQPAGIVLNNQYASPIQLQSHGSPVWIGTVIPLEDRVSFYVSVQPQSNGSYTAFIANPEFNLFRHRTYDVVQEGASLIFTNPKQPNQRFQGTYDDKADRLLLPLLDGYPPFLLSRREERNSLGFFPRTPTTKSPSFMRPVARNDGWATASLKEVGIDERPLSDLVKGILSADPSNNALNIQSLLIARHGKLVFEQYFYGFDQDRTHDMRSASKTFAPVLLGIARDRGAGIGPDALASEIFSNDKPFAHWDERKNHLTLAAIMSMTSGLACDDNDDSSPGNENNMQGQTAQPDWYKYTLDLPMTAEPGGKHAVYCSADLNLVGGAVSHLAHSWLPDLFDQYLARPLQFATFHMNLMPTGEGYMGGGLYLRPRDELKLGQLYLNGGMWNGHRVVSKQWVEESTTSHSEFDPQTEYDAPHEYGYGWHINQLKVGNRTFRAYSAGGNGGQIVMVLPELDLVVGFNGGSYGEFSKWYRWGLQLVPQYIIPAALANSSPPSATTVRPVQ